MIQVNKQEELLSLNIGEQITVDVVIDYEIYYKESSSWGIFLVACVGEDENKGIFSICNKFKISGIFPEKLVVGRYYRIEGVVEEFKGDRQVKVKNLIPIRPTNKTGIINYLKTLEGINDIKAEKLYDAFQEEIIDVLINNPMIVSQSIPGIGKKSVLSWNEQLKKIEVNRDVMIKLMNYGLSNNDTIKLIDKYGDNAVDVVEENPYILARHVKGFGFEKCDKIAQCVGIKANNEYRLEEGIIYMLDLIASTGDCYIEEEELINKACDFLSYKITGVKMYELMKNHAGEKTFKYKLGNIEYEVDYQLLSKYYGRYTEAQSLKEREKYRYKLETLTSDDICQTIIRLCISNRIKKENNRIYLMNIWNAECRVAENIVRINSSKEQIYSEEEVKKVLDEYLEENNIQLEKEQYRACLRMNMCRGGFYLLIGNAGCGKTFILKIALAINEILNNKDTTKLLAPTGKASKVVTKSTNRKCSTIHVGLEYSGKYGFQRNEDAPLECDNVIVDETSMLDILLADSLLKAIDSDTKVIFMGDIKQLVSIGPGNVLKDLIESNVIETFELKIPKRQNIMSDINKCANRVINKLPIINLNNTNDCFFLNRQSQVNILEELVKQVNQLVKTKSIEDIQILSPQKTGLLGTYYLNYVIQSILNPGDTSKKIFKTKFDVKVSGKVESIKSYLKVGDKVIHTKNNYDVEWFTKDEEGNYIRVSNKSEITNGETGIIEDILIDYSGFNNKKINRIIVRYDNEYIFYDNNFEVLELAYAITVHKSQGSQWDAVLMIISNSHYRMLDMNLVYTGLTRAKDLFIGIGENVAMERAVKTIKSRNRKTTLVNKVQLAN